MATACGQRVLGAATDDSSCVLRKGHGGLCKTERMVIAYHTERRAEMMGSIEAHQLRIDQEAREC